MEAKKRSPIKILMLPWLAYGHISPFLELAKKLTNKNHNFLIYLCSSPINLQSIKPKLLSHSSIQLVELLLPSLPDLPPHMHTTNGIPLHLESALVNAFDDSASSFSDILNKLNPDLLLCDLFQPWAVELASSLNIPVVNFIVTGISPIVHMVHSVRDYDKDSPFPELDLRDHWISKSSRKTCNDFGREIATRFFNCVDHPRSSNLILVNTCEEFEGRYFDYLSSKLNKKILPVAPLVPVTIPDDEKQEIIEWLDTKKPKSTVYVSFGSEYYLTKEDREEVAHGLEQSGANFIWVLRFPKGGKLTIEEALPNGFMERVRERGVVVDGWAPQLKILAHTSIGGFVCHCGWNSVVEGVVFGVPIVAMPMQLDQPWHSIVAEKAGFCVEIKRGKEGNVVREEVAKSIREVVFGKIGEGLSEKAREIGVVMKEKEREVLDGVVAEFERVCEVKMK